MAVYQIDPVQDPRWFALLERHPNASIFGSPGWLEALRKTYGYEPLVMTTSPPGSPLTNGLAICRVRSWLAGDRLISLPFSDHLEPLAGHPGEWGELLSGLAHEVEDGGWKYAELRSGNFAAIEAGAGGFRPARTYCLHKLDLSPALEEIFRRFHKSGVQRKVRRAEREGLICDEGRSERLLAAFYRLQRQTRRRHGLPPQPLAWFRNLLACLGDKVSIRIAFKDSKPLAGIVTLSFRQTLVYKYGSSDARFHNLGAMPFLFWRTIQDAKKAGLQELDLGRSEPEQEGLLTFKDHLGATRSPLTYYRFPAQQAEQAAKNWKEHAARKAFALLPGPLVNLAGKLLYRHFA